MLFAQVEKAAAAAALDWANGRLAAGQIRVALPAGRGLAQIPQRSGWPLRARGSGRGREQCDEEEALISHGGGARRGLEVVASEEKKP